MSADATPQVVPQARVRQLRRLLVRVRISPWTVPLLLLAGWSVVVLCLTRVADPWIVALMAMPLAFAALLALLCWWAYRRDFYA